MKTLVAAGVVLGFASAVSAGVWTSVLRSRRMRSREREGVRQALHHVSTMLSYLRLGLCADTARDAAPHLRALTRAAAVAITESGRIVASDDPRGRGASPDRLLALSTRVQQRHPDKRRRIDAELSSIGDHQAIAAPIVVQDRPVGALVALFAEQARLGPDDARVVRDLARLVAAQIELAAASDQAERLAKAELDALRAEISPHFIYNSLAVIASLIESRPDEAHQLLREFAGFIRTTLVGERAHVTLADALCHVREYLHLQQARFGQRLTVHVDVDPRALPVMVPPLSIQPLVENAIRHGVESRAGRCTLELIGIDRDSDVELRVRDDGVGMTADHAAAALRGELGGVGLHNVDQRLRAMFGEDYGLSIGTAAGRGTTVVMMVPKVGRGVAA